MTHSEYKRMIKAMSKPLWKTHRKPSHPILGRHRCWTIDDAYHVDQYPQATGRFVAFHGNDTISDHSTLKAAQRTCERHRKGKST